MSRDPCRRRDGLHRPRFYHLPLFHLVLHLDLITLQYCPVSASKGWPVFQPPYLHSIHASAITCLSEVCSLHPELLARLETHSPGPPSGAYVLPSQVHSLPFSLQQTFPQRPWPVDGGEANPPAAVPPSLILKGSTFL